MNVPHSESNLTRGVDNNLIFYCTTIPLVLLVVRVRIADVDVRVGLGWARQTRCNGWPARLRQLGVIEDAVREACRKADPLAGRGAVYVALEI